MTSKDVTLPLNLNVNGIGGAGGDGGAGRGYWEGPFRGRGALRLRASHANGQSPGWPSTKPTPLCRAAPALLLIYLFIYLFIRSFIFPLMEYYLLFRITR